MNHESALRLGTPARAVLSAEQDTARARSGMIANKDDSVCHVESAVHEAPNNSVCNWKPSSLPTAAV